MKIVANALGSLAGEDHLAFFFFFLGAIGVTVNRGWTDRW